MATAAWSVSPSVGSRAMRVAQQRRRAVEVPGETGAGVGGVGEPPAPIRSVRAEVGCSQQSRDGADDIAAFKGAMGGVLDRRGDLLVRRVGSFGEVMASPLRLIGEQFGQTLVGRAPLVVRRALDHH